MIRGDNSSQVTNFLETNQDLVGRLEYSSFILERQNVMYLDTPKTGCTSIKLALCRMEENFELPVTSDSFETAPELFVHDRQSMPLKSLMDLPTDVQYEVLFGDRWKRFCVVRNPFDRVFSAWFSKIMLREPEIYGKLPGLTFPPKLVELQELYSGFGEFIDYLAQHGTDSDPHWDTQYRLLFMGQLHWDVIIKYERLNEELKARGPDLNGLNLVLPKVNESGLRPDWAKVPERTVENIRKLYALDFKEFGYESQPDAMSNTEERINTVALINAIVARNLRLEQVFQERDELRKERQELTTERQELRKERQELRKKLKELYQSKSWKYTSIFRALAATGRPRS